MRRLNRYVRLALAALCCVAPVAARVAAPVAAQEADATESGAASPAAKPGLSARDPIDALFPLGDDLQVLAEDAVSPAYRQLVDRMLITDLAAEWQRSETIDNAESFLEKHGGPEKVAADPNLKRAYERRLAIRAAFLDVMRAGYRRFDRTPPFDEGATAEAAGTKQSQTASTGPRLAPVIPSPGAERQWPRFRGPDGQGTSIAGPLPLRWSREENIIWRTEIPNRGHSSPVIWDDRIFLTSAAGDGSQRALHCLRRRDGALLWTSPAPEHEPETGVRDKNGYASATPVVDGERVIAFFGSAGLVCYDFEGKQLWHHPLPYIRTTHGSGASPLLHGDLVIFIHDQNRAPSIMLALDRRSGEVRWRNERPQAMGWATPVVVAIGDGPRVRGEESHPSVRHELIYPGGETVRGYDPDSGRELWVLRGPTREVVPTAVVGGQMLYSSSGRNGPTIGLQPGGQGDVTSSRSIWSAVRGGPHVPSPLYLDHRLYTINDTGIATCLNAHSGQMVWQGRIRDTFSASPIAADGKLYFCGESGKTYVLQAGDRFEMLAENDLREPILASPAALDGLLYIRSEQALYCIGSPDGPTAKAP